MCTIQSYYSAEGSMGDPLFPSDAPKTERSGPARSPTDATESHRPGGQAPCRLRAALLGCRLGRKSEPALPRDSGILRHVRSGSMGLV